MVPRLLVLIWDLCGKSGLVILLTRGLSGESPRVHWGSEVGKEETA